MFYSPVSSHYAQAYLQNSSGGFQQRTLPSQSASSVPAHPFTSQPRHRPQGTHKCTRDQCTFSGSQKAVEIHMMDRHLIYPPTSNNKQRDWDADPSLKGHPIVIQGTNLSLNTPEDIEAWIAERKKRFPTAKRVADKKTKLEEAIARGQLPFDDNSRFPKRPRLERPNHSANRGRGSGRGRRGRSGPPAVRDEVVTPKVSATPTQVTQDSSSLQLPPAQPSPVPPDDCDSSDPDDAPPEALPTKSTKNTVPEVPCPAENSRESGGVEVKPSMREKRTGPRRQPVRQPRGPPPVPFGQNTSLLRNLLLPEIKNTVSNLSQAIRFLVDNDFLENVELKPGDAERQKNMIQVVSSTENLPDKPE
ncbi:nuclear fragile X mental retardation-interacting protein 1-domain-containing protein [Thelephora terrestris]|uniref:Nuclear fragile X mental retardation-interacting protein 1-domain-containing protein n=1 Tax=Thelephora terrestris TaxID=56493 RepID=A0A9P6HGM3_9AGAM|nr:nuclear fragile X mental retardation-interacting protein 1-domain-containing protein [Thelephora terrestris]